MTSCLQRRLSFYNFTLPQLTSKKLKKTRTFEWRCVSSAASTVERSDTGLLRLININYIIPYSLIFSSICFRTLQASSHDQTVFNDPQEIFRKKIDQNLFSWKSLEPVKVESIQLEHSSIPTEYIEDYLLKILFSRTWPGYSWGSNDIYWESTEIELFIRFLKSVSRMVAPIGS
jgi:hypothetical protein